MAKMALSIDNQKTTIYIFTFWSISHNLYFVLQELIEVRIIFNLLNDKPTL